MGFFSWFSPKNCHRKAYGIGLLWPTSMLHRIWIYHFIFSISIQIPITSPLLKAMTMRCKVKIDFTPGHSFCSFCWILRSAWLACACERKQHSSWAFGHWRVQLQVSSFCFCGSMLEEYSIRRHHSGEQHCLAPMQYTRHQEFPPLLRHFKFELPSLPSFLRLITKASFC